MHFSYPNLTIRVEAPFDGMDHLGIKLELLIMEDAETYLYGIGVSLEPSIDILHGAQTLAII